LSAAPALSVVRGREREFLQVGDGTYRLTVLSLGVQFTVDRLRRERSELIAELGVACDITGAHTIDGFLSIADCNLSSAHARATRAKLLAERSEAPDIDWHGLVEELCVRTIAAERQGTPSKPLHLFERTEGSAVLDVDGWPWLRDQAMMTFADGGGLKSYLALYGAGVLSRRGVKIGYVDWELSGHEHRDRLERLFGADGDGLPVIHYFRCDRPLLEEADRLARDARKLGLEYLVFDSAGFATAGAPEAAEHALGYFRAVRQIGLGSHSLAHVNRSENGDKKPFGSSFWHNTARSTWFAQQASASPDGQRLTVGLFNRKANLTKLHAAVGFQFDFSDDRTVVTRVNVADVDDLAPQLPLWQRIAHTVKDAPRTVEELAAALDAKVETIKRAVAPSRAKSMFTHLPGTDGVTRIALVDRRVR
jgi:hypothetical protein